MLWYVSLNKCGQYCKSFGWELFPAELCMLFSIGCALAEKATLCMNYINLSSCLINKKQRIDSQCWRGPIPAILCALYDRYQKCFSNAFYVPKYFPEKKYTFNKLWKGIALGRVCCLPGSEPCVSGVCSCGGDMCLLVCTRHQHCVCRVKVSHPPGSPFFSFFPLPLSSSLAFLRSVCPVCSDAGLEKARGRRGRGGEGEGERCKARTGSAYFMAATYDKSPDVHVGLISLRK